MRMYEAIYILRLNERCYSLERCMRSKVKFIVKITLKLRFILKLSQIIIQTLLFRK